MTIISIRLHDDLLHAMQSKARAMHLTQTEYIRRAIERMNAEAEQLERESRLVRASRRVREDSLRINQEFEDIEEDPDTQ